MARITVHTHGKVRERAYADLLSTYTERLSSRGVTLFNHGDKLSHDDYVTKLEAAANDGNLILLDECGESGSTSWFVENWKSWRMESKAIHLAIGPVDGFESDIVERHRSIALGPMTMTYEMAAVVLLEQLYRASEVVRGSPYHRD